jgi:hypothetical protein
MVRDKIATAYRLGEQASRVKASVERMKAETMKTEIPLSAFILE